MKKKILTSITLLAMLFVLASCDLLSTFNAVTGFYKEYNTYSDIYNEAEQFTVLTETDLTIVETTVTETFDNIDSRVYVMFDTESDFMYVEQDLLDTTTVSVFEEDGDAVYEYLIDEYLVTPTISVDGNAFETEADANIFKDDFDIQTVENENKTGDNTYEMDVYLNQAIELDELSGFVDQLSILGGSLSSFDDALAHVVVTFTETDSVIDLTVTLENYTITFEDTTYVTLTLSSHIVISVPENFSMPDVFSDEYQMIACDDILLARRPYMPEQIISYPAKMGESGYVRLVLSAGIYEVASENNMSNFTYVLYDEADNAVDVSSGNFTVVGDKTYFLYLSPLADFASDVYIKTIEDHSPVTTEPVTTEIVTTETVTTETATTEVETSTVAE